MTHVPTRGRRSRRGPFTGRGASFARLALAVAFVTLPYGLQGVRSAAAAGAVPAGVVPAAPVLHGTASARPPAPLPLAQRRPATSRVSRFASAKVRPLRGLFGAGSPLRAALRRAVRGHAGARGSTGHRGQAGGARDGLTADEADGLVEDYAHDSADVSVYEINGVDHILAVSQGPSNYRDDQGNWHDIDTSLVHDDVAGTYANAAGPVDVSFPEQLDASSPASLTLPGGTLEMTPVGLADGTTGQLSGGRLTYPDAAPGVDLTRYATADGFEELVVLKSPPEGDSFQWDVHADGLTLSLEPDGRVSIASDGQAAGEIPVAVATDSSDEPDAMSFPYQLTDEGGGDYRLSVSYDHAWLDDPAREYPVRIDPVPHETGHLGVSVDTFVPSAPTSNCDTTGAQSGNTVIQIAGGDCNSYGFVKFNLTGQVNADRVVYGGYAEMLRTASGASVGAINAYRITSTWASDIKRGDPLPSVDGTWVVCGQDEGGWWAWPGTSTGACSSNAIDMGFLYAPIIETLADDNGVEFRNIPADPVTFHEFWSSNSSHDPFLFLYYDTLPNPLTSSQLGCTANGATVSTDNPLLCVTTMPTDRNSPADPTRVSFQVSTDPTFADDSKIVAESPWLDKTGTSPNYVYPSWSPPSGLLRDGQQYWWRAVSGDWCVWGTGDDPSICPNVDAAGNVQPRDASPARSLTVTLPHDGTDQRWAMWKAALGNGLDLQVNEATGNLFMTYPLDVLASPGGALAVGVTYNSRRAARYPADPSVEQGLSPGWMVSAGPLSNTGKMPMKVQTRTDAQGGGVDLLLSDGGFAHFAPLSQGDFHFVGSGDWPGTITRNDTATGTATKWTYATANGGTYEFDASDSIKSATPSTAAWKTPGLSYTFDTTTYSFPVIKSVKDPLNRSVTFTWAGPAATPRLQSISTWVTCPVPGSSCPSGTKETWALGYDSANRLSTIRDPAGEVVTFSYDTATNYLVGGIQDGEQSGASDKTAITYLTGATSPRVSTILAPGAADPVSGLAPTPTQFAYTGIAPVGDLVQQTAVTDPRGTAAPSANIPTDYTTWTDFDQAGRPVRVLGPYQLAANGLPVDPGNPPDPTLAPIARTVWNDQGNPLCRRTPFQSSKYGDGTSCVASGGGATSDQRQTDYQYDDHPPYPLTRTSAPLVGTGSTRSVVDHVYDGGSSGAGGFTGLLRTTYDGRYLSGLPQDVRLDPTINFTSRSSFCPGGTCTGLIYDTAYWSIRWSGMLIPTATGAYQFKTMSAHGATIAIGSNGVLSCWDPSNVIHDTLTNCKQNDPNPHYFPTLRLTAGKQYQVSITYFWDHATAGEVPTLQWQWKQPGNDTFVAVPTSVLRPHLTLETSKTETPGPTGEPAVVSTTSYSDTDRLHRRATSLTVTGQFTGDSRTKTYTYDPTYGFVTDESVSMGSTSLVTHTDYNITVSGGHGFCRSQVLDPQEYAQKQAGGSYGHTDYVCDESGETTEVSTYVPAVAGQAAQTREVDTTYDDVGRITGVSVPHLGSDDPATWPAGRGWRLATYDRAGRVLTATDPNGAVTTTSYNDQGLPWKVAAPDPDGSGPKTKPTILYGYDQARNRTDVYDPLAGGTASGPHHWTTELDPQNRVVEQGVPVGTPQSPNATYTVTTAYDLAALRTIVSTPGGPLDGGSGTVNITKTTTYDIAGRPVSEQAGGRTASTSVYDPSGNVQSRTVNGVRTDFVYNAWGQVVKSTCIGCWYDAASSTWRDAVTKFTFDPAGRMVSRVDARAMWAPDPGHTWTYTYDGAGRLETVALPDAVSYPAGSDGVTTFTYDAAGDRVKVEDGAGYVRKFTYDVYHPNAGATARRVETVTSPDGLSVATNRYDLAGRLIEADLPSTLGTQTYSYDSDGRLTQRQATWGSSTTTDVFDYDPAGNRISASTSGGVSQQSVAFGYDNANRPLTVSQGSGGSLATTTYSYQNSQLAERADAYGTTTSATDLRYGAGDGLLGSLAWTSPSGSVNTSTYAYDAYGRLVARDDQSGKRTAFAYDGSSRLSSITVGTPSGPAPGISNPVIAFTRTFDQVGNVATEARTVPGYPANDTGTWTYTYDNANRLATATVPGGVLYRYDYDGAGNRWRVRQGSSSDIQVAFDANGYPDSANDGTNYTVDAAGRLTRIAKSGDVTTYSYDGFSRLVRAQRSGGSTTYDVSYTLDPLDRSVVRAPSGGQATTYAYVGTTEQPAFATDTATTSYFYGLEAPLGEKPPGTGLRYYVTSPHGDVVALIDKASGNVVSGAVTAFDPFGKARGSTSTGTLLGYQGQMTDPSTGLVDMLTRNYLPDLGRFVTQDTRFGDPTDPSSLNQFVYGEDNPVTMADPTGTQIIDPPCVSGCNNGSGSGSKGGSGSGSGSSGSGSSGGNGSVGGNSSAAGSNPKFGQIDTVSEFEALTPDQRIAWLSWFTEKYSGQYAIKDWFNSITGVIQFARDHRRITPGSWFSWVDAGILTAVQQGMALQQGKIWSSPNLGAVHWQRFFAASKFGSGASLDQRKVDWANAEQKGTDAGVQYASQHGDVPNPGEFAVLVSAISYRARVADSGHTSMIVGAVDDLFSMESGLVLFGGPVFDPRDRLTAYLGANYVYVDACEGAGC